MAIQWKFNKMFESYMSQALSLCDKEKLNNKTNIKLTEATTFNNSSIYNIDTFTRKFFNGSFIQHSDGTLKGDFEFGWSNSSGSQKAEEGMVLHHFGGLRFGKFKNVSVYISLQTHTKIHNNIFKYLRQSGGLGDIIKEKYNEYLNLMNSADDYVIDSSESNMDDSLKDQLIQILSSSGQYSQNNIQKAINSLSDTLSGGVSKKSAIAKLNVKFAKMMRDWWRGDGKKYIPQYLATAEKATNEAIGDGREFYSVEVLGGPFEGGVGIKTNNTYDYSIKLSKLMNKIKILTLDIDGDEITLERLKNSGNFGVKGDYTQDKIKDIVSRAQGDRLVLIRDDMIPTSDEYQYYATNEPMDLELDFN